MTAILRSRHGHLGFRALIRAGRQTRQRAPDPGFCGERATRIELAFSAWEVDLGQRRDLGKSANVQVRAHALFGDAPPYYALFRLRCGTDVARNASDAGLPHFHDVRTRPTCRRRRPRGEHSRDDAPDRRRVSPEAALRYEQCHRGPRRCLRQRPRRVDRPTDGHVTRFCRPPWTADESRSYQTVSTRLDSRMAPSRVTNGSASALAVATMNRSHGSVRTVRGMSVKASATATSMV